MKRAGKRQRHGSARDGHGAVFQRLPHHFQHVARELRQLVQKQHAVVGQRDLARDAGSCRRRSARRRRWCGAASGRDACPPVRWSASRTPATLWILVVSSASSKVSGGRMVAMRLASMVLPEPGGPIISRLCPPAAAISMARLAVCCPRTSPKSTPKLLRGFQQRVGVDLHRLNAVAGVQQLHHLDQRVDRINIDAVDQRGLARVDLGHDQLANVVGPRRSRRWATLRAMPRIPPSSDNSPTKAYRPAACCSGRHKRRGFPTPWADRSPILPCECRQEPG